MRWVKCIGPEGQEGILKSYVANIAMNLWEHDLLQQWNTQINIPPILETNHKLMYVSGKIIINYYQEQLRELKLTCKIKKQKIMYKCLKLKKERTVISHSGCTKTGHNSADLSKAPTALSLKWLTGKPVWVDQWPLASENYKH